MNSVKIQFGINFVIMVISIITAFYQYDNKKDKKQRGIFICACAIACFTFIYTLVGGHYTMPTVYISREADHSAVVLDTDEPVKIEYKLEGQEEYTKYEGPFKLDHKTVIYARSKMWTWTSAVERRDAYLTDTGLVYFGSADEPGESIKEINAEYIYKDAGGNKSGNHYAGYQIRKQDIHVTGIDLNGEEKEVTEFSYSPNVLENGKNDIEVTYSLTDEQSIKTHLYIEANDPILIKLRAKYTGRRIFAGTELSDDNLLVKGIYEDGTEQNLTDYSISQREVKEGKNKITITKDGLSVDLELDAVDKGSITEQEQEPNNEISSANEIDCNVKYTGRLRDEEDVDYYKIRLDQKGKIVLNLQHPKIDERNVLWKVGLVGLDESEKVSMDVTGEESEKKSSAVRVMPGTYYIKVSSYSHSSEKYTLMVMFEEEDDTYEIEPNDDLTTQAMDINVNTEYIGNLTTENDQDYYKFTLPEKQKVRIAFSHDKVNENNVLWKAVLLGDYDGTITEIDSTGENASSYSDYVRLPAGNYYLRVVSHYWSDIDYKFCIQSEVEQVETESENNDDYDVATTININSEVRGNIQSENDIDFYQFTLENMSTLELVFSHEPMDSNYAYWKISLYSVDSGEELENQNEDSEMVICGNDQKSVSGIWESLSPGTYYIKIAPSYYCNADYEIKIVSH